MLLTWRGGFWNKALALAERSRSTIAAKSGTAYACGIARRRPSSVFGWHDGHDSYS
jgi:hypothetical protein